MSVFDTLIAGNRPSSSSRFPVYSAAERYLFIEKLNRNIVSLVLKLSTGSMSLPNNALYTGNKLGEIERLVHGTLSGYLRLRSAAQPGIVNVVDRVNWHLPS